MKKLLFTSTFVAALFVAPTAAGAAGKGHDAKACATALGLGEGATFGDVVRYARAQGAHANAAGGVPAFLAAHCAG